MTIAAEIVLNALEHRYARDKRTDSNTTSEQLIEFLRGIPSAQLTGDIELENIIATTNPDWILTNSDLAVIRSVDDSCKLIFRLIDLEAEINEQLHIVIPELACQLIESPTLPLELSDYSILEVLDLLVSACVGWANDQGKSGEQLYTKIGDLITYIRSGKGQYKKVEGNLLQFLNKEQKKISKLEERLVASETGILRSKKSTIAAAQMINQAMQDKQLTAPIIHFLQESWYKSMQLLALTEGLDSDQWHRAVKMTETIIWTFQPLEAEDPEALEHEKQQLYRIIEHIPHEIEELLVSLQHDSATISDALEDIGSEHVLVMSGQDLEYIEFSDIEFDDEAFSHKSTVSRILLRKVDALEAGQWFTFEENNECTRIKLVLKLSDIRQLLFTNRNGMRALDKTFDEFAYLLSAKVIKPLNHEDIFSSTFASYYHGLVDSFERNQKLAFEKRAQADRQKEEQEAIEKREKKEAITLARMREDAKREKNEATRQSLLEHARLEAEKPENKQQLEELIKTTQMLNIGAWLKLPDEAGDLEDCKLAVKLTTPDKMIFVSRSGMKIGEYSSEQLAQIIAAGAGEINDGGVEFEDTLAEVVTKLRQDRNKSYDDLTGN